ncbi:MAG: right-handed parallel beta-helix repeat-containing protein [Planctomycetes bacterium]|nr:right-handed parallel beta-helix repeat-containing protein [Planctomycetota bacterium]
MQGENASLIAARTLAASPSGIKPGTPRRDCRHCGKGTWIEDGGGTELVGNVIHTNNMFPYPGVGISIAASSPAANPVTLVNNTVHGNSVGGPVIWAARVNIANSILWNKAARRSCSKRTD